MLPFIQLWVCWGRLGPTEGNEGEKPTREDGRWCFPTHQWTSMVAPSGVEWTKWAESRAELGDTCSMDGRSGRTGRRDRRRMVPVLDDGKEGPSAEGCRRSIHVRNAPSLEARRAFEPNPAVFRRICVLLRQKNAESRLGPRTSDQGQDGRTRRSQQRVFPGRFEPC